VGAGASSERSAAGTFTSLYDEFVERSLALVNDYVLGDPLEHESTLGPMAHVRFADEVRAQTTEAVAAGATALIDATFHLRR